VDQSDGQRRQQQRRHQDAGGDEPGAVPHPAEIPQREVQSHCDQQEEGDERRSGVDEGLHGRVVRSGTGAYFVAPRASPS